MNKPERVGAFRELSLGLPDDPSVLDADRNQRAPPNVLEYLDAGLSLVAGGVVRDVLKPEKGRVGLGGVRTDGVYIWPTELAYYVREHGLRLPNEFLQHIGGRTGPDRIADTRIDEIIAWMHEESVRFRSRGDTP